MTLNKPPTTAFGKALAVVIDEFLDKNAASLPDMIEAMGNELAWAKAAQRSVEESGREYDAKQSRRGQ